MSPAATNLPGLEQFATKTFQSHAGDFPLASYSYLNDMPVYSTARFPFTDERSGVGCIIKLGAGQTLFSAAVDDIAQGFDRPLGQAETNLWQLPLAWTDAQIALDVHLDIFRMTASGRRLRLSDAALFHIASATVWSWNVGGLCNPCLEFGTIQSWLDGTVGPKMTFPLFFPPGIGVSLAVTFCDAIRAADVGCQPDDAICVMAYMNGYGLSRGNA